MKQITDFPNLPLGLLPTPLYRLENLSRELGMRPGMASLQ